MPNTMELIASVNVGILGQTSIDFTSIPSTYTDLSLVMSLRNSLTGTYREIGYRINNSNSGYTSREVVGTGAAAESYVNTTLTVGGNTYGRLTGYGINTASQTANTFTSCQLYFPNYAGSTQKSSSFEMAMENNATAAYAQLGANLWADTAAINAISIAAGTGSFVQYSTAYLYGVKNA